MSDFVVAYFHTQNDAVTSAKKLMTCGVQRSHVKMHVDRQKAEDQLASAHDEGAVPVFLEPEAAVGIATLAESVTLSVALPNAMMINDVCSMLKDTGAYLIDVTEHNATQEYPDM